MTQSMLRGCGAVVFALLCGLSPVKATGQMPVARAPSPFVFRPSDVNSTLPRINYYAVSDSLNLRARSGASLADSMAKKFRNLLTRAPLPFWSEAAQPKILCPMPVAHSTNYDPMPVSGFVPRTDSANASASANVRPELPFTTWSQRMATCENPLDTARR